MVGVADAVVDLGVVEIARVVDGAAAVVDGAAGVVDIARVVDGAAGVVEGAAGVVDGAARVVLWTIDLFFFRNVQGAVTVTVAVPIVPV